MAFQVDPLAQPGTVTLYLGANRGRGQTYPNGDIANGVASRSEAVRVLGNLLWGPFSVERLRRFVRISVILSNHVWKGSRNGILYLEPRDSSKLEKRPIRSD